METSSCVGLGHGGGSSLCRARLWGSARPIRAGFTRLDRDPLLIRYARLTLFAAYRAPGEASRCLHPASHPGGARAPLLRPAPEARDRLPLRAVAARPPSHPATTLEDNSRSRGRATGRRAVPARLPRHAAREPQGAARLRAAAARLPGLPAREPHRAASEPPGAASGPYHTVAGLCGE